MASIYDVDSPEDMPAQHVDCFHHGRAPSIDPRTGKPPVYRKTRRVDDVVPSASVTKDPKTGETVVVAEDHSTFRYVEYGPELPAGGGYCRYCWERDRAAAGQPTTPTEPPTPKAQDVSILSALAATLGLSVEELRAKILNELTGTQP